MHKPNHLLESDVRDQLDWDPALDDTQIVVKAHDGKVTLTGAVPTYQQSLLAAEDTWTVGGVNTVDNQLMVGPLGEAIADADVAASCAAALDANSMVPLGAVDVDVTDGWATLTGTVRHYFQRSEAEHVVRRVAGVRGITDKVEINADPIPGDVAERINKAFRRNAIIDDSLIVVTTAGHTVYLDGTAGSWYAMDEAVDTAWNAPGVTDVINRLSIAA